MKKPIKVAVTGAGGQIGYALIFRIAAGDVFGADQPVSLGLLEITPALPALNGTLMELEDGAFPLLSAVQATDKPNEAFGDADWVILVGGLPRKDGMTRADLIRANGPIFTGQGKAINDHAAGDCRTVVVGNPCNTNALIAMRNAKDRPKTSFSAMTRLDENRAKAQLAAKSGAHHTTVTNVAIWGNHSSTQFPDFENAKIGGKPATQVITDKAWLQGEFIKTVQQRGAAIIAARGLSSAFSAAAALVDHVRDLTRPTPAGDWVSVAICSDGSYDVEEGLISSFPVRVDAAGKWSIVQGLSLSDFAKQKVGATVSELKAEREVIKGLLG